MAEKTLFEIACEMLRETNPYNRDLSEIVYTIEDEMRSLVGLVELNLSSYRAGGRNYSQNNLTVCYYAISNSMAKYLNDFRSSYSFRQKTKITFGDWLRRIQAKYNIDISSLPAVFEVKSNEFDTCITMLKELHSRTGVTKEDLCNKLEITDRAVQKNLRKLSLDLYEGEKENIVNEAEYVPFRIGGQPVQTTIKIKHCEGDKKKYYYTPNTIHPIVLQENLMQVGTLLQALCYNYYTNLQSISTSIATDIWSQLSDYAKDKIRNIYAVKDSDFQEFVEMLDGECPDDYASTYQTERLMMQKEDIKLQDLLLYLAKAPERTATLVIRNNGRETHFKSAQVINLGNEFVLIKDNDGNEQTLNIEDIIDFDID